jgi:hypothetical protein
VVAVAYAALSIAASTRSLLLFFAKPYENPPVPQNRSKIAYSLEFALVERGLTRTRLNEFLVFVLELVVVDNFLFLLGAFCFFYSRTID